MSARKNSLMMAGLMAIGVMGMTTSVSQATELIFTDGNYLSIGPSYGPMPQAYGDTVTQTPDYTYEPTYGFGYGTAGGWTPNVVASYVDAASYAPWGVTDYVMTTVNNGVATSMSLTLTADPNYLVTLTSFKAAYYGGSAFANEMMSVVDGDSNVLWSTNLSGSGLVTIDFGGTPLTASQLTLTVSSPSRGAALNFGIDNVLFSQTAVPEPASLSLLGLGLLAVRRRRAC